MFPIRDHNPSGRIPYVNYGLIAINIIVFAAAWLAGVYNSEGSQAQYIFYSQYAAVPALITEGQGYLGLITSQFMHAGLAHLLGNMLFLWIYGDNIEDTFGHIGYLIFYLVCGSLAALSHVVTDVASVVPLVGASGAISGVMGGYILLFPKARVDMVLFLIIYVRRFAIPAYIVIGCWLGLQLFSGFATPQDGGGTAYYAHIGGFVVGLLMTLPIWLGKGGTAFWARFSMVPPHPPTRVPSISELPRVVRSRK